MCRFSQSVASIASADAGPRTLRHDATPRQRAFNAPVHRELPVTVKYFSNQGSSNTLSKQIDRSKLLSSQTPQAYDTKILYEAIQSTKKNKIKFNFNDVPELILENGSNPYVFKGSKYNIKLTSTEDILLIKSIHQILNSND